MLPGRSSNVELLVMSAMSYCTFDLVPYASPAYLWSRKVHNVEKTLESFEDRLWDLEEHLMGERLEDGKIYVKRRVDRSSRES